MTLRVHCVQLCFNLSDPAREDLLYEAESVRRFCGLNLSGPIPDESTILYFRHLLERHQLGAALLETINAHLAGQGLRLQAGTIVDASIIAAPSSTKNQSCAREPETHQTRKGNKWHFGMKLHIGVNAETGLTHSLSTTAANTVDVTEVHRLLRGDNREAWGDAGHQGVERRPELADSAVEWWVAMRPGRRRRLTPDHRLAQCERASLRAKVEHPFLFIKRRFGRDRVRYRGLAKSHNRLALLLGLTNLLITEPQLA